MGVAYLSTLVLEVGVDGGIGGVGVRGWSNVGSYGWLS